MWQQDYKESWALKNWCFWTVVLEKTLESPRRSNQSILKEISPEYSLEGLTLKMKLQHFGHWYKELTQLKRFWCWERLRARGEGDDSGWDGWVASPTQWTWVWASSGSWWWTGKPGVLQSHGQSDTTERLNRTEPNFWLVTQTDVDKRIKGWNTHLTILQWWSGATFCVVIRDVSKTNKLLELRT